MQTGPLYLLCLAATVGAASSVRPEILADTNRDGIVNHLDATADKHTWTAQHGAIFLPNIGDKNNRCFTTDRHGTPLSNQELASCNDASSHLLLTPELAAPVRTTPLKGLAPDAIGRVYTVPESSFPSVRVFWKQPGFQADDGSSWRLIDPQFMFNATSLGRGLELALDSRELVSNPSVWNGTASVVFEVKDQNTTSTDSVATRQAPVLFHHHLQRVDTVLSLQGNETNSPVQADFVRGLTNAVEELPGNNVPLFLLNGTDEIWAQDFMEPGYASMPGPNGQPNSLRVLVRSAQSTRTAGRQVFEILRGEGVGGHQLPLGSGLGHEEIDSGGNIETIPPYVSRRDGRSYRNGRVIMGKHFDKYPAKSMMDFVEAQGEQSPLILEAGWLVVGHVDEFVQFLPYENELGFTVAIADTEGPLELLRKAQENGYGSNMMTSYPDLNPPDGFSFYDPRLENMTIDMLLSDDSFLETCRYAQGYIDHNLELLLDEIPLSRDDVLRIPTLFRDVTSDAWPPMLDGLPPSLHRVPKGERQLTALLPAAINGVVIGSNYVAAKPWGPVVESRDIFEEVLRDIYGKANMTVHFVDNFMSHHVNGGEVHCGTNTLRDTEVAWWEY